MSKKESRVDLVRGSLDKIDCDGYLLSTKDEFLGEFIPDSKERLKWLSGFSGSNGYLLISKKQDAFLTDGRYLFQARQELAEEVNIYDQGEFSLAEFVKEIIGEGKLAIDGFCYSIQQVNFLKKAKIEVVSLQENLVDKFWEREVPQSKNVQLLDLDYAGVSCLEKEKDILQEINLKKGDAYFVADPVSICWFLNIRGSDVANTPIVQSYLLLQSDGSKVLFANLDKISNKLNKYFEDNKIIIKPLNLILVYLIETKFNNILFDPQFTNYSFIDFCNTPISDPIIKLKARKNNVELQNIEKAHYLDGLALTEFLYNLEVNKIAVDELDAVAKLEAYREKNSEYLGPSFATIMGADKNGAIIHYRVNDESNRAFRSNSIILLDSGGQYLNGTTDVTRVVALGRVLSEVKKAYSLVLKGHIALATAIFPDGTKGYQLDSYARRFLWQETMDYAHGTGHGVGMFLNVHEGPQSISKGAINVPLEEGMVVSNEPGYYQDGAFGIRLENLLAVRRRAEGFLGFQNLTLAPFSKKMIDVRLLNNDEIFWLNSYHKSLVKKFSNKLPSEVIDWIKEQII